MTSRERIIDAAVSVFARKGKHGAHMEEIASLAHINKAMIYYIFHSKDELYYEIIRSFIEKSSLYFKKITGDNISSGKSSTELIRDHIHAQLDFFAENPLLAQISIEALTTRAEEVPRAVNSVFDPGKDDDPLRMIKTIIDDGKKSGVLRNIDTDQLIITIIELVMIYFFSCSFARLMGIEIKNEKTFMEERKNSVVDLVMNGITVNDSECGK